MENVKVNWKKFVVLFLMCTVLALTVGAIIVKVIITLAIMATIIIGSIILAFAFSVYKEDGSKPTSEEIREKAEEVLEKAQLKKMADFAKILQNFVQLNILIRYEGFKPELAKEAEAIIDLMRELIPEMQIQFPGEELTWELGKMAERHFPELIERYVALSPNDRAGMESDFALNLATMKKELLEIADLISKNQQSEFSRKAKEVQLKYS